MSYLVPVCLFCLERINGCLRDGYINESDSKEVTNLFRQFVSFSKAFLRMEHVDESLNLGERSGFLSGSPIKRQLFCGTCRGKLTEILDLYEKLTVLECKLGWKVGDLGEIIKRSEKLIGDQDFAIKKLRSLTVQLQVKKYYLHVGLFRKEVAKKCDLKSRRILPSVTLARRDAVVSEISFPIQVEARTEEVQLVVSLIIVYCLVRGRGWHLPTLLDSLETHKNKKTDQAFVTLGWGSRQVTVPSRKTMWVFISLVLIYSLGHDWKLEEILSHYEIKHPPLQPAVASKSSLMKKNKKLQKKLEARKSMNKIAENILISKRTSRTAVDTLASTVVQNTDGINVLQSKYQNRRKCFKRKVGRPRKICKSPIPIGMEGSTISTEQIGINNVPNEVVKRSPGRPSKKRKGWRGRPPIKSIVKSEFPIEPNAELSENIKADSPVAVEKMEVDIPSPEPSMIAVGFDDDHDDCPSDTPLEDVDLTETQSVVTEAKEDTLGKKIAENIAVPKRWQFRPRNKNQLSKMVEDDEKPDDKRPKLEIPYKKRLKKKLEKIDKVPHKLKGIPANHKKRARIVNRDAEGNDPVKKKKLEDIDCYSAAHGFSIKCSHCPASFFRLFPYEDHVRTEHTKETESYHCSICNKEYDSQLNLRFHLHVKHENVDDKPHFCMYCPESFTTLQSSELHRRNLHWIHPQELFCDKDDCPEQFSSTSDLKEHHKSHCAPSNESESSEEPRSLDVFTCEKCDLSFLSEYRLHLHKFNHYEKHDWFYHCDSCSLRFRSTFALMHHFNNVHAEKEKQELFYCDVDKACDFCFISQKYLDAHRKTYALHERLTFKENNKKPPAHELVKVYTCLYCSHEFNQTSSRHIHEESCPQGPSLEKRQAAGGRYACGKCDLTSKFRTSLERHQLSHMEAKFECPHCDGKFHRESAVEIHIIRMHTKTSQFVCHICGRMCPYQWELKFHLTEHQSLHMCQVCGQRFSRPCLLKYHMRRHTGERFQCEWCPRSFSTVGLIKAHLQQCHPEEFKKWYKGIGRTKKRYKVVKVDSEGGESTTINQQEEPDRQNYEEINIPIATTEHFDIVNGINEFNSEQSTEGVSLSQEVVLQPL